MKRYLSLILLVGSLLLSAGCSSKKPSSAASESESSMPETSVAVTETAASTNTAVDAEQAKAIALADAGVREEDTTFLQVAPDRENGTELFDVEFTAENTEYDYEIRVSDGEIVSRKREEGPSLNAPSADVSGITKEDALAVALKHAGLNKSDVSVTKLVRETEDGADVFKVEFQNDTTEYEYEILASDGTIRENESEPVHD